MIGEVVDPVSSASVLPRRADRGSPIATLHYVDLIASRTNTVLRRLETPLTRLELKTSQATRGRIVLSEAT